MGTWYWEGATRIEPADPEAYGMDAQHKPSPDEWPTVRRVQMVEGRAYVTIEAWGSKFQWFAIDLDGLETDGAPDGHKWVHLVLDGNIPPRLRNAEHFEKGIPSINPLYVEEKFPNWKAMEYEAMAFFMIPFLAQVFTMEPFPEAR
jgi:hypothetical protein